MIKKLAIFLGLIGTPVFSADIEVREIYEYSGKFYETGDGIIFKASSYIGYVGYHEEIIFLENKYGDIWDVCIDGDIHSVEIVKGPTSKYHYSISDYDGPESYEKIEEICGNL